VVAAARVSPIIGAVRANIKTAIPVRSHSLDMAMVVFSPRNAAEWHRILRPDGLLIVVVPTAEHLSEMSQADLILGVEPTKRQRLLAETDELFSLVRSNRVGWSLPATVQTLRSLVEMGPSAHHRSGLKPVTDDSDLAGLRASVEVNVFAPRKLAVRPIS
jgi:23S rRNA (guanine745-N1)-methyltransferase